MQNELDAKYHIRFPQTWRNCDKRTNILSFTHCHSFTFMPCRWRLKMGITWKLSALSATGKLWCQRNWTLLHTKCSPKES